MNVDLTQPLDEMETEWDAGLNEDLARVELSLTGANLTLVLTKEQAAGLFDELCENVHLFDRDEAPEDGLE